MNRKTESDNALRATGAQPARVTALERRGFPVKGGRFVFPEAAEQLSVNELSTLSKILPIPRSYLYDKYSIPVPKDNEPVAGENNPGRRTMERQPGNHGKEDEGRGQRKRQPRNQKPKNDCGIFSRSPDEGAGLLTRLTGSITGRVTLADKYSIDFKETASGSSRRGLR